MEPLLSTELADLIDIPALQKLMDHFYAVAHIPMSVVDLKDRVLVGVGWQHICTAFHRLHDETARYCLESDLELSAGIAPGKYRLYKCKNNLWDIATPILVNGQKVGNIFSGQFFFDDETVDKEFFRAQARRYGFDEAAYLRDLDAVPRLSRSTVEEGMAFFLTLADTLSQLGLSNLQQRRLLAERERLMTSLQRAQEISHLGSWELDLAANALTWSDEVYRIFGLEPREFDATYESFLSYIHPEDRAAVHRAYAASVAKNQDSFEIEHRIIRKATGEVRFVQERCQHFRDGQGRIVRSLGMVHDITERKAQEAALRNLTGDLERRVRERTRELEAANRDLESFSYSVSHDLKAPLTRIEGYAGFLAASQDVNLSPKQQSLIDSIGKEASHMGALIGALLDFSRIGRQALRLSTIQSGSMVEAVVKEQQGQLGGGNRPRVEVEHGELPEVHADPLLLRQVFVNLLSNAFKFTRAASKPHISVSAAREGGVVTFCVADNGAGFPKAQAKELFGVFRRLHRETEFEGTGIGLANVRQIIERHGGHVWAEGEEGRGAKFYFTLPLATDAA